MKSLPNQALEWTAESGLWRSAAMSVAASTQLGRCRRAARDGNGGAKLPLDQFLAAVPEIKYGGITELHLNSCLLADSRGGNKSLKRSPHNPLRELSVRSAHYADSA